MVFCSAKIGLFIFFEVAQLRNFEDDNDVVSATATMPLFRKKKEEEQVDHAKRKKG